MPRRTASRFSEGLYGLLALLRVALPPALVRVAAVSAVLALACAVPTVVVAGDSREGSRIPLHFPAGARMPYARALPRPHSEVFSFFACVRWRRSDQRSSSSKSRTYNRRNCALNSLQVAIRSRLVLYFMVWFLYFILRQPLTPLTRGRLTSLGDFLSLRACADWHPIRWLSLERG